MAANTSTLVNPATGHYDDWFELFNPNDAAADLTGYSLANSLTNSSAHWLLPAGTSLAPHGFLLIWANGASAQSTGLTNELQASFKLSKAGEAIGLFAPNGLLIDSVSYGAQTADISQGRWPDGSATVLSMSSPTPGTRNINSGSGTEVQIIQAIVTEGGLRLVW